MRMVPGDGDTEEGEGCPDQADHRCEVEHPGQAHGGDQVRHRLGKYQ